MNNGKEVPTKAGAHFFRALADILDSASVFYEAGQPKEGDALVDTAHLMLQSVPEIIQ